MPFDYASIADIAKEALAEYGTNGTLGTGATARTARMVLSKIIRHEFLDSKIQMGDYEYIIEAGANPVEGERLAVATDKQVIVLVNPIRPADTVVAWYAYGRKG